MSRWNKQLPLMSTEEHFLLRHGQGTSEGVVLYFTLAVDLFSFLYFFLLWTNKRSREIIRLHPITKLKMNSRGSSEKQTAYLILLLLHSHIYCEVWVWEQIKEQYKPRQKKLRTLFPKFKSSNQTAIRKPGQRAQSRFWMGLESQEREARQAAGRQGADRCKMQRQKTGQVTGAEMRRRVQGHKAGQLPGDLENNAGE